MRSLRHSRRLPERRSCSWPTGQGSGPTSRSPCSTRTSRAMRWWRRCADFDIIVAMRERTVFDAELLGRAAAACACWSRPACATPRSTSPPPKPRHHRLRHRRRRGSTAELTWALILALVRNIPAEAADLRRGGALAASGSTVDLQASTLGLGRARQARQRGSRGSVSPSRWRSSPGARTSTDERAQAAVGATRVEKLDELLQHIRRRLASTSC